MTRRRNWREVERRVDMLEAGARAGTVEYTLANASRLRVRNGCEALHDLVVNKRPSHTAQLLLNAVSASDGSHLHELYQAIYAGPVKRTETPKEMIQ